VREQARHVLPEYMVPQSLTEVKDIPLTPNGKVDRRSLLELQPSRAEPANRHVPPRDLVELQLVQMWEELLGARAVGVTDNFFDVGGYSLLALRLMGRIQRQFEREIPMTALLEASTVEQLASILREQPPAREWSPLVALQAGGSRRPFYFVHAAGGNVLSYVELARHLGPEQPFYGLQSAGLDGLRKPFTRIDEMAEHYVEAVLARQPEGPYLLGGWCMGTAIAFEMAQQLRGRGRRVALLALVDGGAPKSAGKNTLPDESAEVRRFAGYYNVPLSGDELSRLGPDEQWEYLLQQSKAANVIPPDAGLEQVRRLLRVYACNIRSQETYVPRTYPDPIVFYRAAERADGGPKDETYGWAALAGAGVDLRVVPGNHFTMLQPPHVQTLARSLGELLQDL
jgi:thioesterase domain-containing protein/acyl carrier protein